MSSYLERLQASLPDPPQPPQKGTRVFWIDLMRIIGCVAVPIVHAINFTGTPGQPDPKHAGMISLAVVTTKIIVIESVFMCLICLSWFVT